MPTGHMSGNYGELTVKQYTKEPTLIRNAINKLAADQFIGESLFTQGYNAQGGAVKYGLAPDKYVDEMSDPDQDFSIDEGSEFHQVYQTEPGEVIESVRKYAIEGWLTFEDESRNNIGALARLTQRMTNSLGKFFDASVLNKLATDANAQSLPRANSWHNVATTTIIDDIMTAADMAADESLTGGESYNANVLVVSRKTYGMLRRNTALHELWEKAGQAAPGTSPIFGGQISSLAGIPILMSPWFRNDMAFVLERGAIGGIADEVPLTVKPLERDEATERIIIRMKRLTVSFLTDPKALVRITGINA